MKHLKLIQISILFFLFSIDPILHSNAQEPSFIYGVIGSDASLDQMLVDSNGNIYILGYFYDNIAFQNTQVSSLSTKGNDSEEPFILKINSARKKVYLEPILGINKKFSTDSRKIGINEKGEVAIFCNIRDQDSIKIGGRDYSIDVNETFSIIALYSKSGFLRWVKPIKAFGLDKAITTYDVKLDENSNVYLTGSYKGDSISFGNNVSLSGIPHEKNMFLVKYGAPATVKWANSFEPQRGFVDSTGTIDAGIYGTNLEIGGNNNIYVSGYVNGNRKYYIANDSIDTQTYLSNPFLTSFDTLGNANWVKYFTGELKNEAISINKKDEIIWTCFNNSATYNLDDTVYTGGGSGYDIVLTKLTKSGEIKWVYHTGVGLSNIYDFEKEALSTIDDSSNVYFITKIYFGTNSFGVAKLDTNGNQIWITPAATSTEDVYLNSFTYDSYNNVYFNGYTNNTASFSILDTTIAVNAIYPGNRSSFFGRINKNGMVDYVFNQVDTDTTSYSSNHIGADKYGNCYYAGNYWGKDLLLGNISLVDKYQNGIFVSKYNYTANISGTIKTQDGQSVPEGQVKLIGYTYRQKSPIADSVEIQADGSYIFKNVPFGKYLLVAKSDYEDENKYLPTYYVSSAEWTIGNHLIVDKSVDIENADISLIPAEDTPNGKAILSGKITEVTGDDIFKSTTAKPKSGGQASLAKSKLKSEYTIIAVAYSDENGDFEFTNVVDGVYTILIDIPGLPQMSEHNVQVVGGQYISNINYFVDEETITAYGTPSTGGIEESAGAYIYPNPSSGNIYIQAPRNETITSLEIINLQGKTILSDENLGSAHLIDNLGAGIYIAKIVTQSTNSTIKFVIYE